MEEIELLDVAGDSFDLDLVRKGELTPMFFGSAINNFGVEPFLKRFLELHQPAHAARERDMGADRSGGRSEFHRLHLQDSGQHESRRTATDWRSCASVRGVFDKGHDRLALRPRTRRFKLKQPQQFMADEREAVENAYPGDIIGLFDPGIFALGDSLCTGQKAPLSGHSGVRAGVLRPREQHRRVIKRKQFVKGVLQLSAGRRDSDLQAAGHRLRGDHRRRGRRACSLKCWNTA